MAQTRKPAPVTPRRPRRKPRKPEPAKQGLVLDWYAVAILVFGLIAAAPYIARVAKYIHIIPPPAPAPVDPINPNPPAPAPLPPSNLEPSIAKVVEWMQVVSSEKPATQAKQYAEALEKTVLDCASGNVATLAQLDEAIRGHAEATMGPAGWLDWSLFTLEMFREMQSLRAKGSLQATVASHAVFLDLVAKELRNRGVL